jgi:hypothetical protein
VVVVVGLQLIPTGSFTQQAVDQEHTDTAVAVVAVVAVTDKTKKYFLVLLATVEA